LKRFKKNKPDDEQTDAESASGDGYSKPARDSLKKLIEKPAGR
jgi:membrane protein required for colicin V production